MKNKKKVWSDYLWIASLLYLVLGFFNIMFAWLGLICFVVPLVLALSKKGKIYCNHYCGRGKLLQMLGGKYKLSRNRNIPAFLRSKWFRYGFLAFFMTMFANMILMTYRVFMGVNDLRQAVTILWTFKLPWHWAYYGSPTPWMGQFAFGFYSVMLTSTILALITMVLYKPRSWCVYCPMGTMTQGISVLRNKKID